MNRAKNKSIDEWLEFGRNRDARSNERESQQIKHWQIAGEGDQINVIRMGNMWEFEKGGRWEWSDQCYSTVLKFSTVGVNCFAISLVLTMRNNGIAEGERGQGESIEGSYKWLTLWPCFGVRARKLVLGIVRWLNGYRNTQQILSLTFP